MIIPMGFKGLGVLSDIGQPTELYDLSISHQHWAHRRLQGVEGGGPALTRVSFRGCRGRAHRQGYVSDLSLASPCVFTPFPSASVCLCPNSLVEGH